MNGGIGELVSGFGFRVSCFFLITTELPGCEKKYEGAGCQNGME